MKRRLFWKLCLFVATGTVLLFYFVEIAIDYTEEDMSYLSEADRATLKLWGQEAESLYNSHDQEALNQWLELTKQKEQTWISVAEFSFRHLAGDALDQQNFDRYNIGRSVDWKVHLYFDYNPVMEIPFQQANVSLLVELPERMRPGGYLPVVHLLIQVFLPFVLLSILCYFLYRHIMKPLAELQRATQAFMSGHYDIRVMKLLGHRDDELTALARTFDMMAERTGELIISQRQLIADLSHELRTPLARLDIALECLLDGAGGGQNNLQRIQRESLQIRRLVDDTLTLAWLENESPDLQHEDLDLIDLLDVLAEDAKFEFKDRDLLCNMPNTALLQNSSHQALGQAIENVLRNAMRFTPPGKAVHLSLIEQEKTYLLSIVDQGPGVSEALLESIFKPFFRVDKSRQASGDSFGLGLALAKRQLRAVGANIWAENLAVGGLQVSIQLCKQR